MEKETRGIEKETTRQVIKRVSKKHILENDGFICGQCIINDGRVRDTVPEMENGRGIVEFPMADVAGGSMAVGAAVAGRRPIYISRFQGFQWYNSPEIVNYAAKSKEMWKVPCPIFVRSAALDGGIGPVASASHHGLYFRMPGIPIAAPMTPKEYEEVWDHFMANDDPVYVSEHRSGWPLDYEMEDVIEDDVDITLFPISSTRLNAIEAAKSLEEKEGIKCNIIHLLWLKPFGLNDEDAIEDSLQESRHGGLVLDGDYAGAAAKNIAYDLMHAYDERVYALGLEDKTAGFAPQCDNLPPSAEKIYGYVKKIVR